MENNNINFESLWNKQTVTIPSESHLIAKANAMTGDIRKKNLFVITALIATALFIGYIWQNANFEWLSTKIGTSMVIASLFLGVGNSIFSMFKLKNEDFAKNSKDFLAHLLKIKQNQEFSEKKILSLYFALLSVGLGLYMLEPCSQMPLWGRVIAYILTFAWILFAWFYLRPKKIKKQQQQLNELIEKLTRVQEQLS